MTLSKTQMAVLLTVTLVIGVAVGVGVRRPGSTVANSQAALQRTGITVKPSGNKEQDFALSFYQAFVLHQDPGAAWDMMEGTERSYWLSLHNVPDRNSFVAAELGKRPYGMTGVSVQEARHPELMEYVYRVHNGPGRDWVIKVTDETGKLKVLSARLWEGDGKP